MEKDLNKMKLTELMDLLIVTTEKLLKAIEMKADGYTLRDLKSEVEKIQAVIKARKKWGTPQINDVMT